MKRIGLWSTFCLPFILLAGLYLPFVLANLVCNFFNKIFSMSVHADNKLFLMSILVFFCLESVYVKYLLYKR